MIQNDDGKNFTNSFNNDYYLIHKLCIFIIIFVQRLYYCYYYVNGDHLEYLHKNSLQLIKKMIALNNSSPRKCRLVLAKNKNKFFSKIRMLKHN